MGSKCFEASELHSIKTATSVMATWLLLLKPPLHFRSDLLPLINTSYRDLFFALFPNICITFVTRCPQSTPDQAAHRRLRHSATTPLLAPPTVGGANDLSKMPPRTIISSHLPLESVPTPRTTHMAVHSINPLPSRRPIAALGIRKSLDWQLPGLDKSLKQSMPQFSHLLHTAAPS